MKTKTMFSFFKEIFFQKNVLIGKKRILAFFLIFLVSVGIINEMRYRAYAQTTYTLAQVKAHNSPNNPPGCWIIVKDTADNKFKVYNITSYFSIHPGGASTMTPSCGAADATNAFKNTPHSHSTTAWNLLRSAYYIGDLAVPDTQNPTISITSPANNQAFTTTAVTVSGTANDNVGLAKAEARIGNGAWVPQTISGTSAGYSISVSPLVVGNNTISVRSTDTSGRLSTVVTRTVTYSTGGPTDTQNPTVSITSPTANQVFTVTNVTVTGTATDNVGLAKVEARIGTGSWVSQTISGKSASYSISVSPLVVGNNTISVRSTDTSGRLSTVVTRTVTYSTSGPDTTDPTVTINTLPATVINPTLTVAGSATDNVALSKVEVWVGSGVHQVRTLTGKTASWSISVALTSGANTIHARTTDTSDNFKEAVASVTFNPPAGDTQNPTATISSPLTNTTVTTQTITVSGTARDNVALSRVEVRVGSGAPQIKIISGTNANWSVSPVTLTVGSNTIAVRVFDTSSRSSSVASITVTYSLAASPSPSSPPSPSGSPPPGGSGKGWGVPTQPGGLTNDLAGIVMNITNWTLGFIALIAVLMIIWGGVQYLTAAGDESMVEGAKKTITYGVIGLVIVGLSYAIVVVVVNTLIGGAFS